MLVIKPQKKKYWLLSIGTIMAAQMIWLFREFTTIWEILLVQGIALIFSFIMIAGGSTTETRLENGIVHHKNGNQTKQFAMKDIHLIHMYARSGQSPGGYLIDIDFYQSELASTLAKTELTLSYGVYNKEEILNFIDACLMENPNCVLKKSIAWGIGTKNIDFDSLL